MEQVPDLTEEADLEEYQTAWAKGGMHKNSP
jgi:hypothetical protein